MMLFLIKRTDKYSYCDDYEMVVCAENVEQALRIAPNEDIIFDEEVKTFITKGHISLLNREKWSTFDADKRKELLKELLEYDYHSWTKSLDSLEIKYLGEADSNIEKGPILIANTGA